MIVLSEPEEAMGGMCAVPDFHLYTDQSFGECLKEICIQHLYVYVTATNCFEPRIKSTHFVACSF